MTSTAAASSFLSPTRASEGRDSLSANPRCTGDQTTTEGNEREAGTLNGAAQSPFYKPGGPGERRGCGHLPQLLPHPARHLRPGTVHA